jgi:hypothetical protein
MSVGLSFGTARLTLRRIFSQLYDILEGTVASARPDWHAMSAHAMYTKLATTGHCSALIKLTGKGPPFLTALDCLAAQTVWLGQHLSQPTPDRTTPSHGRLFRIHQNGHRTPNIIFCRSPTMFCFRV